MEEGGTLASPPMATSIEEVDLPEPAETSEAGEATRGDDDDITLITAEGAWDVAAVVNDARVCDESEGGVLEVIEATIISPWWKQRSGQAMVVTALLLLTAIVTAIGLSSRDDSANKNDGVTNTDLPGENITMAKRGPHVTCPSDESAKDCGATLEIWSDVPGWSIMNLVVATDNFTLPPNRTERLIDTLSGPFNVADNYGCRITGWLVPPITSDEYFLMVSGDNEGELWLSEDDDPINRKMVANFKNLVYGFFEYFWEESPDQQSSRLSLVAGRSYYFEVSAHHYKRAHTIHFPEDILTACPCELTLCLVHMFCYYCAASYLLSVLGFDEGGRRL